MGLDGSQRKIETSASSIAVSLINPAAFIWITTPVTVLLIVVSGSQTVSDRQATSPRGECHSTSSSSSMSTLHLDLPFGQSYDVWFLVYARSISFPFVCLSPSCTVSTTRASLPPLCPVSTSPLLSFCTSDQSLLISCVRLQAKLAEFVFSLFKISISQTKTGS